MKEELLKELVPILQASKESLLSSIEVIKQQAPQLVNEIYRWEITMAVVGLVIGIVLLSSGGLLVKNWNWFWERVYQNDLEPGLILVAIGVFVVGALLCLCNIIKIVQILTTPKLYLLKYITGLFS